MTHKKCCSPPDSNKKFLKSIRNDALRNFSNLIDMKNHYDCEKDKYHELSYKANDDIDIWTRLIGNDISGNSKCGKDENSNAQTYHYWVLVYGYTCYESHSTALMKQEYNKCCKEAKKNVNSYTLRCRNSSYDKNNYRQKIYCNQRINLDTGEVVIMTQEECEAKW